MNHCFKKLKNMSPERTPGLSEKHKQWVKEISAKIRAGDDYFKAVRQVLTNHRVTHPPDVERLMKELSRHVDDEIARQIDEEEVLAEIAEEKKQQEFRDIEAERGGDPDD